VQRIGAILKAFLASRLSGGNERTAELVEACRALLGQAREHARVRDIRGSTLLIEVDHPGWGQMVALRKGEILRRLGERFPEMGISELRIVSSGGEPRQGPEKAGTEGPGRRRAAPAAQAGAPIDEALSGVRDDDLRRSLRSLYERADDSGAERR